MRIGLDATVLAPATRFTGGGRYALQLFARLTHDDSANDYVLYGWPGSAKPPELGPRAAWHPLPRLPLGKLSALAGHLLLLPRLAREHRLDLLHAPTVQLRPSMAPVPRRLPCPLVVTLHDVIPITFYEASEVGMPWRLRLFYRWNLRGLRRAARIITVSEASRREILHHLGLPGEQVVAVYNGVDFGPGPPEGDGEHLRRLGVAKPYILYVGSYEPRKNLPRLLRAYALAAEEGLPHRLVLVVEASSGHAPAVHRQAAELGLGPRLRFLHSLPSEALRALYRQADLFVFPSLSEGFGLPPLEAMACGCPVVASRIDALEEVLGDAACLVDPLDVEAIAAGILKVLGDPGLRERLVSLGRERTGRYRWEETARRTLEVYSSAVRSQKGPR